MIQSTLLAGLPGIAHGFGTRDEGIWTPEAETAKLHQVHGNTVISVGQPGPHGDGDGLLTAVPGLWLEIRTADCVPVLLADPVRRVVAAIHAGWRGTAARITAVAVARLQADYGSRPEDLVAAVGPCIASCCFEVGDEVAAHFPEYLARTTPRAYVDLVGANQAQLADCGVTHVDALGLCTVCEPGLFHSFRRDKGAGRMEAAIRLL